MKSKANAMKRRAEELGLPVVDKIDKQDEHARSRLSEFYDPSDADAADAALPVKGKPIKITAKFYPEGEHNSPYWGLTFDRDQLMASHVRLSRFSLVHDTYADVLNHVRQVCNTLEMTVYLRKGNKTRVISPEEFV